MRVLCIDDKNLPPGGEVVEGEEYKVMRKVTNHFDQVAFLISGINNSGKTKMGMDWIGYRAERFVPLTDKETVEEKEKELEIAE